MPPCAAASTPRRAHIAARGLFAGKPPIRRSRVQYTCTTSTWQTRRPSPLQRAFAHTSSSRRRQPRRGSTHALLHGQTSAWECARYPAQDNPRTWSGWNHHGAGAKHPRTQEHQRVGHMEPPRQPPSAAGQAFGTKGPRSQANPCADAGTPPRWRTAAHGRSAVRLPIPRSPILGPGRFSLLSIT